jgi:hypothetical protein
MVFKKKQGNCKDYLFYFDFDYISISYDSPFMTILQNVNNTKANMCFLYSDHPFWKTPLVLSICTIIALSLRGPVYAREIRFSLYVTVAWSFRRTL